MLVYGGHYNTSHFNKMAITCICLLQSKTDVMAMFFIALLELAASVSERTIRMCVVVFDSG